MALLPYRSGDAALAANARTLTALGWLTGYMPSETMYRAALLPLDGEPWYVLRALDTARV